MSNAYNAIQRTVAQRAAAGRPNTISSIADIFGLGGVDGGNFNRKAGLGGGRKAGGAPRKVRSEPELPWPPLWFLG